MTDPTDRERDPLEALRASPGVAAEARFADELEARLRVAHAETQTAPAAGRGRWRVVYLLPVALALVVAATVTLMIRDDAPSAALELVESVNVTITLPDGTELLDPVGLRLAEGTVVSVGTDGRAVIDGVELAAGSTVVVRDEQLVTSVDPPALDVEVAPPESAEEVAPPLAGDPPEIGPIPARPGADASPVDDREPGNEASDRPRDRSTGELPTDPVDRPADGAEAGDGEPVESGDRGENDREPPGDTAAGDDPAAASPRQVDLGLRVEAGRTGVHVRWRAFGADLGEIRVVLLRVAGGGDGTAEPDWPVAGDTTVLGETAGSEAGVLVDVLPSGSTVARYRVVAVVEGEAIARSAVQSLFGDRLSDPSG